MTPHPIATKDTDRQRSMRGAGLLMALVFFSGQVFEIVVFENHQWQDYLRFFGAVMTNRLHATDGVAIMRATRVEVNAPEDQRIYIQTDGEAVGVLPATISIVPDALTLLMPKRYVSNRQNHTG